MRGGTWREVSPEADEEEREVGGVGAGRPQSCSWAEKGPWAQWHTVAVGKCAYVRARCIPLRQQKPAVQTGTTQFPEASLRGAGHTRPELLALHVPVCRFILPGGFCTSCHLQSRWESREWQVGRGHEAWDGREQYVSLVTLSAHVQDHCWAPFGLGVRPHI